MQITVKNFMGCASADVDASQIALISGNNHQGKSSFCRAAAACLSGQSVPLGLRKTDAGMLIASGQATAEVAIETEGGKAEIKWPKAERYSDGVPINSDPAAVGLISFPRLNQKDALDLLVNVLHATPTKDDLRNELPDLQEKAIDKIWGAIERDGWAIAHTAAIDKGKEFKAQWKAVTGRNYGTKVAESWEPSNWDSTLAEKSVDSLEASLSASKIELEDAIARNAVSDADRERLTAAAEPLDDLAAEIEEKGVAVEALEKELSEREAEREALPAIDVKNPVTCPHCDKPVIIDRVWKGQTILKKFEKISEKELSEREDARARLDGKVENVKSRLATAQNMLSQARIDWKAANDAATELANLPAKDSGGEVDVDAFREKKRRAEADLSAFVARMEADRHQKNILANQKVIDALEKTGVRRNVLVRELNRFNGILADICKLAGWKAVEVETDMTCTLGGRPFVLLSDSEQYRVTATLQIAIADITESAAVVMDAAEVLDNAGRVGLLKILSQKKIPAIIGMMLFKPESAPNLAKAGAGKTYWAEAGTITEIGGE